MILFEFSNPIFTTNVFFPAILSFSISRMLFKFNTATLNNPMAVAGKNNFQSIKWVNKKLEPTTETNQKKNKYEYIPKTTVNHKRFFQLCI